MIKKTACMAFLIALFVLIADGAQYGLSGTITSFYFNAPVESCFVKLHPESPTAIADSMFTDRFGRYSFPKTWPGVYTVCVSHKDYLNDSLYTVVDSPRTGNFELMKKTNVYYSNLPDTLKKANAPYIIGDTMTIEHSLFVEPGTAIVALQYLNINGPQLMALGTRSDSITFTSKSGNVDLNINSPVQRYRHCTFFKLNSLNFSQQDTTKTRAQFDTCHFSSLPNIYSNNIGLIEMHNSIMAGCYFGGYTDTIKLFQNMFYWDEVTNFSFSFDFSQAVFKNNNFLGDFSVNTHNSRDTIMNNIFNGNVWLNNALPSGIKLFFAYNDIPNLQQGFPGIGNPVIQNDNGYPCDLFFNINADPLFEDALTGVLQSNSPCIRAGLNGKNIGVWQGNITAIARRPAQAGMPSLDMKPKTISLLQSGKNTESRLFNGTGPVNIYSLNGRRLTVITINSSQNNSAVKRLSSGMFVAKMSGSAQAGH
jgi:hypothetical protein